MSVPLYVIVSKPELLRSQLAESSLLELLDEEQIATATLPNEELDYQLELLECYEQFSTELPPATVDAFEKFADTVFWSWREGTQTLDSDFEPEGIDSSYSPETCASLKGLLSSLDRAAINRCFVPGRLIQEPEAFWEYLDAWREILARAEREQAYVFTFVF